MWYVFHHENRIEHTVPGNGVRVLTFVVGVMESSVN